MDKKEEFFRQLEDNINRLQEETDVTPERQTEYDELMKAVDMLGMMCDIAKRHYILTGKLIKINQDYTYCNKFGALLNEWLNQN